MNMDGLATTIRGAGPLAACDRKGPIELIRIAPADRVNLNTKNPGTGLCVPR
jgi:hypothetical protein